MMFSPIESISKFGETGNDIWIPTAFIIEKD
jgi:hypothetical protein